MLSQFDQPPVQVIGFGEVQLLQRQGRIVLHTLGLAGMGMVLAIPASRMLSRALGALLFGVTSTDPATFLGIVVTLAVVAAIAG